MDRPIININVPEIFKEIIKPWRYTVYYGGRGSEKSWTVARYLIAKSLAKRSRILCTREFQNSIQESVHHLLEDQIFNLGLSSLFTVRESYITNQTGSEFIFKGLAKGIDGIKSTEGITDVWVEEAERISQRSLDILIPTIREKGSRLYFTFNPQFIHDPIYQKFIANQPPDAMVQKVNYKDAPHFPEVLRLEMEHCKATDFEKYLWIWEGNPRTISDAQIFKGKFVVEDFSSEGVENFRFGADFGFGPDPATLVRDFIRDGNLYIDYEAYGHGIELRHLPAVYRQIPLVHKYKIKGDNSRPETIAFLQLPENGNFRIEAASKWPESVAEGIEFIKSFNKVIIHPRCKNTIFEFGSYAYKTDKLTDEVLPIPVDKHNHCLAGNTLIQTDSGLIEIAKLPEAGFVFAHDGKLHRFTNMGVTQKEVKTVKITFNDGRQVVCTKDHLFITLDSKGAYKWKALVVGDILPNFNFLMAENIHAMKKQGTTSIARQVKECTEQYMNFITGKRILNTIYITLIMIGRIIKSKILNYVWAPIIKKCTGKKSIINVYQLLGKTCVKPLKRLVFGMVAKPEPHGTVPMQKSNGPIEKLENRSVHSVARYLSIVQYNSRNFALTLVNRLGGAHKVLTTSIKSAMYVVKFLELINIQVRKHAREVVVISVSEYTIQDVYNLHVEDTESFLLDSGVCAHNCIDAVRYSLDDLIKRRTTIFDKGVIHKA
jgi:phage terminase large subunit